ncbi:MAG: two-component sensor histidine kinase [Thermoleophilia bacterium]|nr:two-component sensor histidine kinase [Thermoleophilia bacterium]
MKIRLGLTSRLALAGVASALLPFIVGGAILLAVPERIAARQVDPDLDQALARASAQVQSRRATIEFALASSAAEARTAARSGADDVELVELVQRAWADAGGEGDDELDVEVRELGADRTGDDPISGYLELRDPEAGMEIAVQQPGATNELLGRAARDLGVGLAVLRPDMTTRPVGGDVAGDWSAQLAGSAPRFTPEAPTRWRTVTIDSSRQIQLVAAMDGTPMALLLHGRGGELRLAVLFLLAAGMLGGVAVALIMNRMLRTFAASAERMSSGDFDIRMPVAGSDAGARVATSLNDLAGELQVRIGTLERAVDQLDRTLSSIDDGVCAWDESGRIATWNAGAARITGVDIADARSGAPTAELLASQRRPGRRRILLPLAGGTAHLAVDLSVRRMKGGGILQVFRDAAPSLSIEQARTNFLVTAAHELRTPLTSILGFASTLADPTLPLSDELRRQSIEQLLLDAQRLDDVVDSLFESSLLARDKVSVTPEPVEAVDAIASALESLGDAGNEVIVDAPDHGVVLRADRRALVRALCALIDNAIKYGHAPVEVAVRTEGANARISVSDHGPGIPVQQQDAIFEPFHRLDPEMRSAVGGAGMGLYSARRLVEAMGGRIELNAAVAGAEADGELEGVTCFAIELATWTGSMRAASRDRDSSAAHRR